MELLPTIPSSISASPSPYLATKADFETILDLLTLDAAYITEVTKKELEMQTAQVGTVNAFIVVVLEFPWLYLLSLHYY